ncbi:hypothetical protein EVAR_61949_1 [Eumeta japonica]|uniref:Uncharacterized protein n=1 Tax=Eumeta variegata TaxID=151549 RepID=A0A4C1ZN77_EUMVA|nr:hypothetical protein EVAR_61949_1 [Eumeta japonica]
MPPSTPTEKHLQFLVGLQWNEPSRISGYNGVVGECAGARGGQTRRARMAAPMSSGAPPGGARPATTHSNFEYDDNEWDIGIGDLIIDLDADIEKTDEAGGMAARAEPDAQRTALKMKIKRTKPGTKSSEAKHEIVKSNEMNGEPKSHAAPPAPAPAHPAAPAPVPAHPSAPQSQSQPKRGSGSHRRDKARDKHPHHHPHPHHQHPHPHPHPHAVHEVNGVRAPPNAPGPPASLPAPAAAPVSAPTAPPPVPASRLDSKPAPAPAATAPSALSAAPPAVPASLPPPIASPAPAKPEPDDSRPEASATTPPPAKKPKIESKVSSFLMFK